MKRLFAAVLALFFGGAPTGMAGTATVRAVQMGSASTTVSISVPGLGGASGSTGAAAISREQALAIAKGIFPEIGSMDVDTQLNVYQAPGRWILSWSDPGGAIGGPAITVNNIEVDAVTGALDGFRISDWKAVKIGSPLIARDEALRRAEEFIRQYRPEELAQTVLSTTYAPTYSYGGYKAVSFVYDFQWDRMVRGVPVLGDGIQVGVNPFSGRIQTCSFNWHDGATFPEPATPDAARKTQLMDQFGVILCYQVQPGQLTPQGVPEASLVYTFNCSPSLQIDPVSGGALASDGKPVSLQDYVLIPGLSPTVTAAVYGSRAVAPAAQEVGQDVAKQNASRFFQALGLSDKAIANGGGGGGWDGIFYDRTWSYTLQTAEGPETQPGQRPQTVEIDAATGEVRNYVNFQAAAAIGAESAAPGLSPDEARDRALAFIKQVSPDKAGQIVVTNQPQINFYAGGARQVPVYFTRLIDGIPFPQDGITVILGQSGEVVSYNCSWHRVALAPAAQIIPADQARQILLQNLPLKEAYSFPVSLTQYTQGKGPAPYQPVFALRYQSVGVAADTGRLVPPRVNILDIGSGAAQQAAAVPPDHWAAAPLSILADSGLLPAEDFKPDAAVTCRDALRVLIGSCSFMPGMVQPGARQSAFSDVGANDPDYGLIQAAVDRGVLDPGPALNPDGTLDRETFVKWLVRAMGYRLVAEMPTSIDLNLSDLQQLSASDRNYAAIAEGLGIVKGDTRGMFYPDDPLTWADLAMMVAKAAPRLQTL